MKLRLTPRRTMTTKEITAILAEMNLEIKVEDPEKATEGVKALLEKEDLWTQMFEDPNLSSETA